MSKNIDNYFNNTFGMLVLFVFVAGIVGDIVIHMGTKIRFPNKKPWFAQGLRPYYKSLEYGKGKLIKSFNSWLISGIFGGIACIVALVFGQLFMYVNDNK